jgi:hypothetical protein
MQRYHWPAGLRALDRGRSTRARRGDERNQMGDLTCEKLLLLPGMPILSSTSKNQSNGHRKRMRSRREADWPAPPFAKRTRRAGDKSVDTNCTIPELNLHCSTIRKIKQLSQSWTFITNSLFICLRSLTSCSEMLALTPLFPMPGVLSDSQCFCDLACLYPACPSRPILSIIGISLPPALLAHQSWNCSADAPGPWLAGWSLFRTSPIWGWQAR